MHYAKKVWNIAYGFYLSHEVYFDIYIHIYLLQIGILYPLFMFI